MEAILGGDLLSFIILTVILFGGAGFLMGQAVANTWRSPWQLLPYSALLTLFERFLAWSLLGSDFASPGGLISSMVVIFGMAYLAYRLTLTSKMVTQYPWIYERAGPLAWRERR